MATPTLTDFTMSDHAAMATVDEDTYYEHNTSLHFTDADGDTLTYSATLADGSVLPGWLSIDTATGVLSGTPLNADIGAIDVMVTATDSFNDSISDTYTLSVTINGERGDLLEATLLGSYTQTQASVYLLNLQQSINLHNDLIVESGFKTYKISYKTIDADGNLINASGAVAIPNDTGIDSSIIVYSRGTSFTNSSVASKTYSVIDWTNIPAAMGYIVIEADYLGYGDSQQLNVDGSLSVDHPYMHAPTLASANIDMLRAVQEFLANESISTNDNLFLAGYSEGGAATMATHKEIETNFANEFNVTISAPGAGAYNFTDMLGIFLSFPFGLSSSTSSYVLYIAKMLHEEYNPNNLSVDNFVNPQFIYIVENYYDGSYSGAQIQNAIGSSNLSIAELLNIEFLQGVLSGQIHPEILQSMQAELDIHDWSPQAPVKLFSGIADLTVPIISSEAAFNAMIVNGVDVELITASGYLSGDNDSYSENPYLNHGGAYIPYLDYIINTFNTAVSNNDSIAVIYTTNDMLLDNLSLDYFKDGLDTGISTLVEGGDISFPVTSLDFDAVKLSDPAAYTSGIVADDAVDILRDIVFLDELEVGSAAWHAADVNNDGMIAADDAVAVLRHIVYLDTIDTFDLVDNTTGNRVTNLDPNSALGEWTIVANGDVNQSGSFNDGYTVAVDIV